MNKNVKIAKELLVLAKSLVVAPRGDYRKLTRRVQQHENELENDIPMNDPFIAKLDSEYKRVKNLLSTNGISNADITGDFAKDLEMVEVVVAKGVAVKGEQRKELENILIRFGHIDENKMQTFKTALELKRKVDELYLKAMEGHEEYYDDFLDLYSMKSYQEYEFSIYVTDCGLKELRYCEREFTNAINGWKQCQNIANWVMSIYNSGEQGREDVSSLRFYNNEEYVKRHATNFKYNLEKKGYKYDENYVYSTNSTDHLK